MIGPSKYSGKSSGYSRVSCKGIELNFDITAQISVVYFFSFGFTHR